MAKWILRISVVLIFVLSGAALVFGVLLFQERETLKGRTQRLEKSVKQVAGFIETGDDTGNTIMIADDQLKTFKQKPGGPPTMDVPLNQLETAAKYQLDRLNSTRVELADTKDTLMKTEADLKQRTEELDLANEKIGELNETIEAKNEVIKEKEVMVQNLEREKEECENKTAAMQGQIDELQITKRDLTDTLAELMGKVGQLEKQVSPALAMDKLNKGLQGVILYVNPEWNFVVFGISPGNEKNVQPDLEFLVHRGDQLIGKVKVANVVNSLAIADIMGDWELSPMKKNDDVIY